MSRAGIITMLVIVCVVWGGFLLLLLKAMRKERHKST